MGDTGIPGGVRIQDLAAPLLTPFPARASGMAADGSPGVWALHSGERPDEAPALAPSFYPAQRSDCGSADGFT